MRLGPLVGYAAKYEEGKHWVGDEYANCAKLESHILALNYWCIQLGKKILTDLPCQAPLLCGLPEGGKAIAELLALHWGKQWIYAEKKVTAPARPGEREVSELIWGRHSPQAGDRVLLVEDVLNNASTTIEAIRLVGRAGADVVGLACLLNRSPTFNNVLMYTRLGFNVEHYIRIIALEMRVIPEYHQDDPCVQADVAAGNVIWKPKLRTEWAKLEEAMAAHP